MKTLFTSLLIMATIFCYGQESKTTKNAEQRNKVELKADTPDKLAARTRMLNNEIQHIEQGLDRLQASAAPKAEKERAIRKAQIHELELEKMWKEKELAIAKAESANEDVAGLRGEAKALQERYTAAKNKLIELKRSSVATQAEKGDETAVPNQKIKLQREQLRALFHQHQSDLKREQQSENPDAERMAKLKGDMESIQRQIDELNERK